MRKFFSSLHSLLLEVLEYWSGDKVAERINEFAEKLEKQKSPYTSGSVSGTLLPHGESWIMCLDCKRKSYHPEDIKHGYCGNCHKFHPPVSEQV